MDRKQWRKKRVEHRRWAKMQPGYNPMYDSGYAIDVAYSSSGMRSVRFTWLERARIALHILGEKERARKGIMMARKQRLGRYGTDLIETPCIFTPNPGEPNVRW